MLGFDGHLVRPRINTRLAQAIKYPLTIVCGAIGCGKTRAVHDFTRGCDFPVLWLQFSHADNPIPHFWQIFVHAVAKTNEPFARELKKLGFPDTADKLNIYCDLCKRMQSNVRRLYVLDDFHQVQDAAALNFLEQIIFKSQKRLSLTSVLLISRELPSIDISSLIIRDRVSVINEEELNFTESELRQFLLQQKLNSGSNSLSKLHRDTADWALIINLAAQTLEKISGYTGHARIAILRDIVQLIEA